MNPIVHDIVVTNQRLLEPFVEFFDDAMEKKSENLECITDQHGP